MAIPNNAIKFYRLWKLCLWMHLREHVDIMLYTWVGGQMFLLVWMYYFHKNWGCGHSLSSRFINGYTHGWHRAMWKTRRNMKHQISVGEIYMFANRVGCSWRTSVPSLQGYQVFAWPCVHLENTLPALLVEWCDALWCIPFFCSRRNKPWLKKP